MQNRANSDRNATQTHKLCWKCWMSMTCVNKILHLGKHCPYLFFHRERLVIQCQKIYYDIPIRVQGLQHSHLGRWTQDNVALFTRMLRQHWSLLIFMKYYWIIKHVVFTHFIVTLMVTLLLWVNLSFHLIAFNNKGLF